MRTVRPKNYRLRGQLACLAAMIAGAGLIAWGESGGRNDWGNYEFFGARSVHVSAQVVDVRDGSPRGYSRFVPSPPESRGIDVVSTPTVRFTTAAGREIEVESACPTERRDAPRVGSTVEVVYDRDEPIHACLADGMGRKEGHITPLLLWGLGGVILLLAAFVSVTDLLLVRKYGNGNSLFGP